MENTRLVLDQCMKAPCESRFADLRQGIKSLRRVSRLVVINRIRGSKPQRVDGYLGRLRPKVPRQFLLPTRLKSGAARLALDKNRRDVQGLIVLSKTTFCFLVNIVRLSDIAKNGSDS